MGKVIAGMTMSLDGFVNDRRGDAGPLYPNLAELRETEWLQEVIRTTGAVVMGRHSYDMAQATCLNRFPQIWIQHLPAIATDLIYPPIVNEYLNEGRSGESHR
jgi:hypothetical protein